MPVSEHLPAPSRVYASYRYTTERQAVNPSAMDVVTLGMLIIDEIHFQDGRPPANDVLGGAGSWAVFGARIWCPPPHSKKIGWTVHKGLDFPNSVEEEINSWQTACNFIDTPQRSTTRGWNQYGDDEERAFKYMTEKLRIDQTQLTEPMLRARCFHLICTPNRCINLVEGILAERAQLGLSAVDESPWFVWEPVPDSCGPDELANLMTALKHVDVVSPNHQELAALMGGLSDAQNGDASNPNAVVKASKRLLGEGFLSQQGAVVVRCGGRGCYVASGEFDGWLPAYHQSSSSEVSLVVDPTGAGNAFLGGLCWGLVDAEERKPIGLFKHAAICGSVAAGCAVEQVGLPKLTTTGDRELWNGVSLEQRAEKYTELLKAAGIYLGEYDDCA